MKSILKLITGVALIATPTASIIACSSNTPIQPIIEDLTPDMLPIKPHMLPINNVVPNLSNILINRNLGHVYCKVDNGDVFDQQMLAFLKEREPEVLNGIKWDVIYISSYNKGDLFLNSNDENIYIGQVRIEFINDWK